MIEMISWNFAMIDVQSQLGTIFGSNLDTRTTLGYTELLEWLQLEWRPAVGGSQCELCLEVIVF